MTSHEDELAATSSESGVQTLSEAERRRTVALALLIAGTFFMQILDGSVITPAIPDMAKSFGVAPVDLNLGISTYMLTVGVFVPVSGWAAQRFGARPVFLLSIVLFTLASAICGFCESLPQFVASRVLQGFGGSMMLPVGRLIVLSRTPKDKLVRAMALLIWPALIAPVLGPPVGGFLTDNASWNWIFWLNLPLGIVAFAVALRILPKLARHPERKFDWLGFVYLGPALFCLLFGAEFLGQNPIDWPKVGALAIVGFGLLWLGFRHLKRTESPLLRFDALSVPTFAVSAYGGSLFRISINAIPFLLPLMFQIGFGWTAFQSGSMLMAMFLGNVMVKPLTSWFLRLWGFRNILIVNGLINAVVIAAMIAFDATTPVWIAFAVLFVSGLVRSLQFTAIGTMAFADLEGDAMAEANTLNATIQQLSRALGVAVGAIAWRFGETVMAGHGAAAPFRLAFAIIAVICLLSALDAIRLAPGAGDHVARAGGRKSRAS